MQRNLPRERRRSVHRQAPQDAFVDAEVGLLLSGSRDVVSLMIGNAVADTFDAGTDSTTWRLVLSPNGSAQVFRNESSLGTSFL